MLVIIGSNSFWLKRNLYVCKEIHGITTYHVDCLRFCGKLVNNLIGHDNTCVYYTKSDDKISIVVNM